MKLLECGRHLTSAWHVILTSVALTFAEGLRAKYSSFTKISGDKLEYVALQRGAMRFTLCLFVLSFFDGLHTSVCINMLAAVYSPDFIY